MATVSSTSAQTRQKKSKKADAGLKEVTGYDLFYQLIYMSAVAAAGISRRRIFQLASDLPRQTAAYFRRIHLLSQRLGYDYSRSCNIVGMRSKSEVMKSLLLRFADSLTSGQAEAAFLAEETEMQTEAYEKEYERDLESLTKWTDAYAAVVISSALIIIVNLISVLIYPIDSKSVGGLVVVSVLTSAGGAWVLYRSAPPEKRALFAEDGPPLQRQARTYAFAGMLGIAIICLPMGLLTNAGVGPTLVLAGLILLPTGITSLRAGREVEKKDKEIGSFLRSLGGFATSTGTTIRESLERLDISSFPNIRPDLELLRARLNASIDPNLCWRRFGDEAGSKLIQETTVIFHDAVGLGGAADTVGLFAAKYAALTNTLRAKRIVVSSTFSYLTMVMHAVLAALMIIILELIRNFTAVIEEAMAGASEAVASSAAGLPAFGSPELGFLQAATIGMVILLAIVNAIAIVVTDGAHIIKVTLYLSILLISSGISFIILPPVVAKLLAL